MADDKKKQEPIVESEWVEPIVESEWSEPIVESEWSEPTSPKSPAPSTKGGESGALVRPLTPTSASEGSELESWTQTINPFADKGAVKPTQQAGATQAPKAKLLKVIPSSEKKSPELLKARVDTYGDMYKRAMDRAYTLKQSVEGVDNELKNSKAYVDSNPNDQNAINSYNALISKRNEMAEMARMEIARADAWQKGIEKTQLEIDDSLTASESISNSISNMATQIKGFLPASGLAISTLQNKMMQGAIYVTEKLMGADDETASKVSVLASQNLPSAGILGTTQKEASQFYTERLGELEKEQKPTKSIIKTFEEGDVAGLGAAILDGGSSVLSSVITSAPTGGVGIFTEMMGRSVYDFNNEKAKRLKISVDELYDRGLDEAAVPLAIGAVSASLEKIGLDGISKAINKKIGSKAVKDIFEIVLEGSKEAGTEWLQTGAEEYNKAIASGMNAEQAGEVALSKMLSEEGREAALKGAAGSGVSIATGRAAKSLYGMAKSNRDKLYQDLAKVETLARERANPNLSSEALSSIDREINNTTANMQKEVLDQLNRRANLTEENASLVEGIEANVKTISDDIESKKLLSEDPSLSDDAKIIIDLEIADLEAKRLDLAAQSEEIIKNNKPIELKKNTSPTSDKYGTINRNDGKGVLDLTKEEFEAEQAKMQPKVDEQVTPTAEGERVEEVKLAELPTKTIQAEVVEEKPTIITDEKEPTKKEDGEPMSRGVQGVRPEGQAGKESAELRPEEEEVAPQEGSISEIDIERKKDELERKYGKIFRNEETYHLIRGTDGNYYINHGDRGERIKSYKFQTEEQAKKFAEKEGIELLTIAQQGVGFTSENKAKYDAEIKLLEQSTKATSTTQKEEVAPEEGFDYNKLFDEQQNETKEQVEQKKQDAIDEERESDYQKSFFDKKWAKTYKEAKQKLIDQYNSAKATKEEWEAKKYKSAGGKTVFVGGELEGQNVRIDRINQKRKNNAIKNAQSEMDLAKKDLAALGLTDDEIEQSLQSTPQAGSVVGASLRDVELKMRRPEKNEVIFVSVDALLQKHAADQPSYDVQKEGNRIKGRVEKAKEFIKNYIKDQRAINPKTGERMNTKVSFEPSVVDIDANGKISFEDGRHRVLAAKEMGLTEVPIEVPKERVKAVEQSLQSTPQEGSVVSGEVVKDNKGQPLTLFHGTGKEFTDFDIEKTSGVTRYGKGVSFTDAKGIAIRYSLERQGLEDSQENDSKAIVKEANVSIKAPFDDRGKIDKDTPQAKKLIQILTERFGLNIGLVNNILDANIQSRNSAFQNISEAIFDKSTDKKTFMFKGDTEKTRAILEEAGYDSIIGEYEDATEYFIFNPKNILSKSLQSTPTAEEKVSGGLTQEEKTNLENISKDAGVNFQEVRNVYNKYGEGKPLNEITLEDYQKAEEKRQELLTPKQEEDAKKQQSGQMREQGVQDQPQRKGDSDMPIINEAELQDGEAVEEEVTQEELNKQQDKETQVLLNGEAAKRRSAGKFIKDGVEYVRNKVDKGIRGIKGSVKFAEGVPNMPFTYKLVEAETLQPSHSQGVRNQMHFIPEAQPKRRNDEGSIAAEMGFANYPRFNELGEDTDAYGGAPIVNERNEVVQGNNRSAGLKLGYKKGVKKYKNALIANAEKFGFTREQVEGMKNPILVREIAFNDDGAIEHGNYDVKDLETGGKRRIDPLALVKRIPLKEKARLAKLLFSGEGTLNSNIRANSKDVLAILNPFLNQAQRTTLLKDGEITSSGVEDIEALVQQFLFDNGDMALPELFENLPYRQREGIRKSLPFIFSAGVEADVIPEIQNAILALNQFQSTGIENFDTWLNQSDVFADNKTPRDIYTPQELAIARALNEAKTQSEIVDKFKSFSSAVQGTPEIPANLIDEAKPAIEGQSKEEALKQIFNVKENESRQKENLRGGKKVDKQQEAPKQKPKEPTAEEVEEEGLPKLTKEQQIEAERRSLNEPKNVSDLAKIFNKILGLSPKESVMAARLFDVKAKNMSELLGITKDEYYQRYWFTGEQEGGLSQMTLPDGREVTVKRMSPEVVNGFYSPIEKNLMEYGKDKIKAKDWLNVVGKGDEAVFTGVRAFLEGKDPNAMVSKQEILDYMKDNRISVVEVVKGEDSQRTKELLEKRNALFIKTGDIERSINAELSKGVNGVDINAVNYLLQEKNKVQKEFEDADREFNLAKKDDTKFSQYQLEGEKENYKEVLVTLPSRVRFADKWAFYKSKGYDKEAFDALPDDKKQDLFIEFKAEDKKQRESSVADFKSTHFDEPNILVHLRMNTRTDADGNKVLFLEEVQSDWGQLGKKEGFTDTNFTEQDSKRIKELNNKFDAEGLSQQEMTELTNLKRKEKGISLIPTAPFVMDTNAWTKLGLKVALKEAVAQGADKIAWTTGTQQFDRWGTEKIDWIKTNKGWTINIQEQFRGTAFEGMNIDEKALSESGITITSKEDLKAAIDRTLSREKNETERQKLTDRIWDRMQKEDSGTSLPRKEGMESFYGTEGTKGIVGGVAEKLFGQKVGTVNLTLPPIKGFFEPKEPMIGSTQPSIDITPELKAQVQEGLPLFQDRRGAWSKIAASAKRIISMYDKARLDTAVHEILGHDFLDEIISLSATNKEFEQDLNTIIDEYIKSSGNKTSKATLLNELKNFNVESNNQSVNARAIHEWFSRTAEGYFMGETNIKPDSKLAKMFEQFRQYLTDLFNTMTSRNYIIPSEPMKQIFRKAFGTENFDFVNDYAEANIMEGKLDVLRITENEIPQSRLDKFKKLREAKRGLGQEEDVDIDELVDAARYLSTDPTVNVFSVVDELVSMYPQKEEYIRKHSKTFEKVFVAEGKKVRETARSVYESDVVSPEMKQRAATIEDLFSYTPEKLQEKMEDVESLIADYSIDDLMAFFATNNEIPFKEYPLFLAAMQKRISRAINELDNSNQGQSAAKQKLLNYEMTIMDRYIAEGTATGQRLNYFKVLKNMSTDGKLRFFKRKFKEESGNAVKEFQDLISNLRKERDKAYKDNDYFLEENLSLEQRIEDLEAELAKERSTKAKNDKRKDRESLSQAKPPKRKISQSELNDILKELGSAGLGQSLEDLNAALKLGFYIIQDKPKTIEQFTRDWNKITKQNKTQEELSQVYRDVRKYATENEGVDIDYFDSDAMIQSSIDSFNERASQKKNLAKKELDSDIAKAEKEAKDKDDAPSQLAKAILSNAKKELGLGKKQQDYVKELLGYLKNKAKDYYKTTNKQALVDPFEQLKYAVEMLNDANGRKIWDDSKAELIAKIDSDKDLSQQEKDDLKAYLDDYQNAIFDQLLSKNKLFNNVKKVLAEESPFVKKDGSVDWNGIIIQAKGNVEIAKQIILDSVADKLQGYSGSQVNSVIDAIGREYQRRINEKRAEIIEKQLKDISDKKVIFKKKIATGFVQKLVEMENSGALGDQRFEQALKEWIGFSDMTPDKWNRLRELIVDAEEAPEGNERDRAIENLSAYIKFNKIGKFAEIYASAYYAGLLARPTTIIKNSTGIIEPLLTLFYKSFTDRNYAKAMLQGLKRGDAADIWGGGLVQGGKLDEEVGNDGLPRVNMLKQWRMQEKGIIPKLFALGARPLDLLSMADALSQAMVERGAEYEFYARYLLEKNKEDIKNGVQGVAPITEKEARRIAIKRLSDDAMLDWAFAQAEDEFASRKIVPSSARLNRRAYEIVSESLLPTSVRELAQNLALEESYKSKLISFRGMTAQTRAQKRLETNYGVATFLGSFAKGLVDLLGEGGGYVAGATTKVLPVTEARRNQIRNSVERAISMRVLPFARGISNVVEKGLEKTPYGIVSGVVGATAEKLSYGKPKTIDEILQHQYMMNRNKAKIAKSATSMIIGSAIYYTLLSASKEWDDEEEKEERYYLPTGFYSAGETVRFGKNKIERYTLPVNCVVLYGRIIPLSLFGTVGIGSMITAQAYDNFLSKEKKKQGAVVDPDNPESIKGFSSFVSSSGNAILNMSAMQSISELQESVSSKGTMDFGDYASKLSVKSIALPIPFSGTANQIIQGARYLSGDKTAQAAIGADEKIYKELGLAGIVYNRPVLDWRGRPVNAVLQNQEGIASFVSMLDKRPLDKIDMYLLKELEFNPVIDKRLSENFADLNMVGMSKDEYYDYTKNVGRTVNNYIEAYFDKIKDYQIPQDKIDELAAEGKKEADLKKQLNTIKKTFVSDFLNIAEQEHMLNYQFKKGIIKEAYEAKFKANNDRLENLIEKINNKGE